MNDHISVGDAIDSLARTYGDWDGESNCVCCGKSCDSGRVICAAGNCGIRVAR